MSADRRSLIAFAFVVAASCGGKSGSPTAPTETAATDVVAQFDQLWTTFDRNYSYFDYKRMDWTRSRPNSPRA